ncbi:putative membrane protein [Propionispora sp. 2/2-37]|uniref:ABC transporter permease n=1 Tax=Propionispora sp. 2/2-37 TaxID=1677858 RepID=UPI0006BB8C87|nr:ABC transporter permease [Propionispora sp. 2/2-37]CUH94491.1 putative membrane protein [Propionispora sp. 2/2-37]
MIRRFLEHQFLFEELVKRDFKNKYKRTVLGVFWSMLSPLLSLLVMSMVFGQFFGRTIPHYISYLLAGQIVFSYFSDATHGGMGSLMANSHIFTKVNVPKYMFLLSRNISSLMNFSLTFIIFLLFALYDGLFFSWKIFLLLFPIICLIAFNIGVGMILSALYIFFRDIQYLYSVFTQLLVYCSAIFYNIEIFDAQLRWLFYLNPVYVYISYFRMIVLQNIIPDIYIHLLAFFYAFLSLAIGGYIYKKYNYKFLYYV